MLLMLALDAFHPPAGITPVLIANTHASAWFIVSPVATGIAVLLIYAFIFHRLSGERWPERWS